jgi:hypothetical protein
MYIAWPHLFFINLLSRHVIALRHWTPSLRRADHAHNSRYAKNTRLVDWLVDVISIDLKRLQEGACAEEVLQAPTNRVPFNLEYRQVFRSVAHHLLPVAHHLLPLRPTPSQKMTRNTRRPDKISSKHCLEMHRVSISQKLIHQGPKLLEIHRLCSHLSFRRWTLIMMPSSHTYHQWSNWDLSPNACGGIDGERS